MLELNHIYKSFGSGITLNANVLNDLTIHIDDGEFVTVIGGNGAGKSTMFNCIAGTFFCDSGNIILDGRDVTFLPEHKRARVIGRLFQNPMLGSAPHMSIEDNLTLAAGKGGWLRTISKTDRSRFRERLSLLNMGLENRMQQPVGLLSGGQRQALTLVMATINPPKLLLLDEHTAALDPATATQVLQLTKQVVEEDHITCMMITHNMQSALKLGTRTIMMHHGQIIYDVRGEERNKTTVNDLLEHFRIHSGQELNNDRMLLVE